MTFTELQPIKTIRPRAVVSIKKPQEKGVEFARFAMALGQAQGNIPQALEIAKNRFNDNASVITVLKAAVAAGNTAHSTWAAPLVEYRQLADEFIEFLRPQTIIGRFGVAGVPALRAAPFNVKIPRMIGGGSAAWVQEGMPKPVTSFGFDNVTLDHAKIAAIAVITDELLRFSNPSAELLVRDGLAGAVIERMDKDFIDPAKAAVASKSPASITYGLTPLISGGSDSDAIRRDVRALFGAYLAANVIPLAGVWIMNSVTAFALSLMVTPLGEAEFPGITMTGGKFFGLPVIASGHVPAGTVILANASDIFLADDGEVEISASNEASLQMDTEPTNNSVTPTPAQLVSLWQTNSTAFRCERWIFWEKRRANAVVYMTGVSWGEEALAS